MGSGLLKNWRVLSAAFFSAVLVVGAYLLARDAESPSIAQASAETALLQAIATKDSNGDGLPDWEKALYGIPLDSATTDYFNLGMTDGEAVEKGLLVPKAVASISTASSTAKGGVDYAGYGLTAPTAGTLTEVFAKNFFALYLEAKQNNGGADLSAAETSALAGEAMNKLAQTVAPTADFKTSSDIAVSGTGPSALRTFAAAAEAVFKKNRSDATTDEIQYLQNAVNGDSSALDHLASLAVADRAAAAGIAALPVPQELAGADLELVNALMRIGEIVNDFARINVDPLTAILALQQYLPVTQSLGKAFTDIADTYATAGVVLAKGTPGAAFVNVLAPHSP